MGSSFVDLNRKGFWIRDGLLELWLLAVVREIDSIRNTQEWLHEARNEWYLQSTIGLVGCISPNLDHFVTAQERKVCLIEICQAALQRLTTPISNQKNDLYVKSPPGGNLHYDAWLNDILADLHNYALHNLIKTGERFLMLLRGELNWKVSSRESASWMVDDFKYNSI